MYLVNGLKKANQQRKKKKKQNPSKSFTNVKGALLRFSSAGHFEFNEAPSNGGIVDSYVCL